MKMRNRKKEENEIAYLKQLFDNMFDDSYSSGLFSTKKILLKMFFASVESIKSQLTYLILLIFFLKVFLIKVFKPS